MQSKLARMPGLDGLRGTAVIGILLFHADHLPGGWLGVDLFFVLSGYLITSLLFSEFDERGDISLRAFWARRGRRLLPALFAMLLGVAAMAAATAAPEDLARIRADGLATLFYVANWNAILGGHEYWDLFRQPSPLDHTWSLAIEEQFYLLWPVVALAVLRRGRASAGPVAWVAGIGALTSALWMAWLFDPSAGTARVYYGTDTRLAAPLVGAALAGALHSRDLARSGAWLSHAAWAAAALLAVAWISLPGDDPRVYRGGLLVLNLTAAVLVASIVLAPQSAFARTMSLRPLRALGFVSYGVYLWHWPIYLLLDPANTGLSGWGLTGLRIGVTLIVAALSHRLLEQPIRSRRLLAHGGGTAALAGSLAVAGALLVATGGSDADAPGRGADRAARLAAQQGPLDLLLIGDSQAQTIEAQFLRQADQRGMRVNIMGRLACGALKTPRGRVESREFPLDAWCQAARDDWDRQVAGRRPRMVMLMEGWPGIGWMDIDGAWRRPCDAEFDEALRGDLTEMLRRYQESGAEVVIVNPAPTPLADMAPEMRAATNDGLRAVQLLECQNQIRREVAADLGARVVELTALVCPDGPCLRELDGLRLRTDGVHYRGAGAYLVSGWIFDQLGL